MRRLRFVVTVIMEKFYAWLRRSTGVIVLLGIAACLIVAMFRAQAAEVTIDQFVNTTATTHNGTTLTVVFTSDQVGYAFYRTDGGSCAFRKTTDGGATWPSRTVVDTQSDCIRVAVWYDRWTPGNTTGTLIHVATMDTGSDDLFYTFVDTATDATTTVLNITGANQGGTFATGGNLHALTRATDGTIYVGVQDGSDSFVVECNSNCAGVIANWREAGVGTTVFDLANDWMLLAPLSGGNVLAVRFDISADDVQSKIWQPGNATWTTPWTNIDTNCVNNGTYDGHFGLTINKLSGDIFMAFACDTGTIGGNNDDIRTAIFYNASSSWATTTDVLTDTTYGVTGAKVGLDANTGNIYVVYSARVTSTIATTTDVFYKISTSSMQSWGVEQGPLNSTRTDIYGLRIDGLNDERIYATWVDIQADTLEGNTVADLVVTGYEQRGYKFFGNMNSSSVGYEFGTQNTSTEMANQGTPFRLRLLVRATGEGADIGAANFKLQIATSTQGGCDTGFSGETYVDVTTSTGDVRFYDNTSVSDGVALNATSTDPTDGTSTIVNQTYEEQNPFSNSVAKIFGGQDGKWDFPLIDVSAPANQTYCFRVVKSDDSLLNSYNMIAEVHKNTAPTVGFVSLNSGNDISLTEGTSTLVQVTTTVNDANGLTFDNVTMKLFRSGVTSSQSCAVDDNNCYENSACQFGTCGTTSCDITCRVNIWFHAEPTDAGTPWSSEDWLAWVQVTDSRFATGTATSTGEELLTLLALDVTSTISYGNLSVGSTTDPLSPTTTVIATGNTSIDVNLFGIDMTFGSGTIPVLYQHFATSAVGYATSTALAISSQFVDLNIPKSRSTSSKATSSMFWGIQIPNLTLSGGYTGTNSFVGSVNALPWP